MSDGFFAVPEEIRQMASHITDAIGDIAGLTWQKPSGDYGHPGVQSAWASFLDDLEHQVGTLHRTAAGHSENLKATAIRYSATDIENGTSLEDIVPGGGFGGPVLPDSLQHGGTPDSPEPKIGWGRAPDVLGVPTDDGVGTGAGPVADEASGGGGFIDPNIVRRAQGLPPRPVDGEIGY
jgi:hypothetical protein